MAGVADGGGGDPGEDDDAAGMTACADDGDTIAGARMLSRCCLLCGNECVVRGQAVITGLP